MRALSVLPVLLMTSAWVLAQQAPPPPPAAGATQLDAVLAGWEQTMSSVRSLQADCQRTELNKTFQSTEIFKGTAKYLKAAGAGQGSRASLELYKQTPQGPSATIYEKYICTGTYLYEFVPANKVIRIHDLPKPKVGQISDDSFLGFLFGMKAAEAKQRYHMTLTPSDQYYHYIIIQPKLDQDKEGFTKAQLVLRRDNLLPARVWFCHPNKNEITWDFPQTRANVNIPPSAFEQPRLPTGWQWERVTEAKAKIRGTGP
jgi:TIGR03009 family protein